MWVSAVGKTGNALSLTVLMTAAAPLKALRILYFNRLAPGITGEFVKPPP
jgi:hypothetical protein